MTHLDELALEAIAHGRNDLVADEDRLHLSSCDACAALLDARRAESKELVSLFAREAAPLPLPDLESMIAHAIARAPAEPALTRPSWALVLGSIGVGVAATGVLAFLSLDSLPSLSTAVSFVRDGIAVVGAVGRLLEVVPGGLSTVALAGALVLALLALPLRRLIGGRAPRLDMVAIVLSTALVVFAPGALARALDLEGTWPETEASVTVSVDRAPVSEALEKAAEASGLGFVSTLPADVGAREVTLHVSNASLRDVLEAVLGPDAPVVARRTASMLVLSPAASEVVEPPAQVPSAQVPPPPTPPTELPSLAVPPVPPVPPVPAGPVSNVETFGEDIRIRAGERVRNVTTMGGDVVVEGEVLGNLTTMGGDVEVREGGVVHGEIVTMGGDVEVRAGGATYGQMVTMGGDVDVDARAIAKGGRVRMRFGGHGHGHDDDDDDAGLHIEGHHGGLIGWVEDAVGSLAKHALLFVFGVLLMVFAPKRFAAVRRRIGEAPVRAGVVGVLGFIGTAVMTVVLLVTIVGIPAAVVVALGAFVALYIGLTASGWVLGASLPFSSLRDKPVRQLGAGLLVLFLVSLVPVIGGIATFVAVAVGFGAVIFTRFRAA